MPTVEIHSLLDRLVTATNGRDVEALASCFAPDYVNETPAHPGRGFVGRPQVRKNWEGIFAGVPDIEVTVLRASSQDSTIWTEWEMSGTRADGARHLLRGVIIFEALGEAFTSARFYLEPVTDDGDADAAVVRLTAQPSRARP